MTQLDWFDPQADIGNLRRVKSWIYDVQEDLIVIGLLISSLDMPMEAKRVADMQMTVTDLLRCVDVEGERRMKQVKEMDAKKKEEDA